MFRFIPVLLFAAVLFTGVGASAYDVTPSEARMMLADMYCPEMFVFYAQKGDTEMVKLFLIGGMDVNVRLKGSGDTALMRAANVGHLDTVKLLMDHGADIGLTNDKGETALIKASSKLDDGADDTLSSNGSGEIRVTKTSSPDEIASGKKKVIGLLNNKE